MESEIDNFGVLDSLELLKAYEKAVDKNIISSITDANGIIVHTNKQFCEISQYNCDEILGKSHSIINSGYHSQDFFKIMWKTITNGNVWHDEIKNKAKDGSFYWVDTVIVPIKGEMGQITHYLSLRTLITPRKLLDEKKAQYVSSLEALLVMTSNGIKKPLSNCLNQINDFDFENSSGVNNLRNIISNLKHTVSELDNFTRELTTFIREMKK